jgi:ribosome-binding ATPase
MRTAPPGRRINVFYQPMGLSAGIVGLPNVGKSTLFNALCGGRAQVENYPFTTIDPNTGVVAVPDDRLGRITQFSPTQKVVPAFLEFVDIAGLVKGASKGEGLGNQFLGHIKNVNALVHVVRCFEDENVVHVEGSVDPVRDVSLVETELLLADLGTVERAIARVEKAAKSGDKALKEQLAVFRKAHDEIASGKPCRNLGLATEEAALLAEINLLTAKPVLFVANVDEASVLADNAAASALRSFAAASGSDMVRICGKMEAEIADLPIEERPEFLAGLGLDKSGLALLAVAAYRLLGLETFFTATEKENRAWTVRKDTPAAKAAGTIHTDFEKGFIRAEVFTLADLEEYKSEAAIRAAGKVRSEGREYVVKDGDIIFFRFNV